MNGIELKSGLNDCYWNTDGKCTHNKISGNCTYTQIGIRFCSEYFQQSIAEGCKPIQLCLKKGDTVRFKTGNRVEGVIDAIYQDIDSKEYLFNLAIPSYSGVARVAAQPHLVEKVEDKK